jgi:hypothetical protein
VRSVLADEAESGEVVEAFGADLGEAGQVAGAEVWQGEVGCKFAFPNGSKPKELLGYTDADSSDDSSNNSVSCCNTIGNCPGNRTIISSSPPSAAT